MNVNIQHCRTVEVLFSSELDIDYNDFFMFFPQTSENYDFSKV